MLRVEVTAPSPLLKSGLAFVDTPGVGGHGQPHLSATLGLLPDADAMLMVSDTSQEFTEPEMNFIRQALEICPLATILVDQDRSLPALARDRRRPTSHTCSGRASTVPLIPVSSVLRSHAIQMNDKELNEESNFPAIVKFLSDKVLSGENDRVRDQVLAEVRSAAEHLTLAVTSELSSINDPEARDRLTRDLERRKQEAMDALAQTALWQQVLNDGIADLTADVDHDLRGRFRAITQHTEKVIDGCDPTQHWAEIGAELENAIATAVGDNFVWAYQRAEALAEEVARNFQEAGIDAVEMPADRRARDGRRLRRDEVAGQAGGQADQGGPQGGDRDARVLRRRADVRHAHLLRRARHVQPACRSARVSCWAARPTRRTWRTGCSRVRNEAKTNMRRFVDDVSFVVSKESRDRLKGIQRQLRDHYRGIANQTTRSLNESLQAALAAAKLEENERATRIKELERQLDILRQVTEHALKLSPQPDASPQPAPT